MVVGVEVLSRSTCIKTRYFTVEVINYFTYVYWKHHQNGYMDGFGDF